MATTMAQARIRERNLAQITGVCENSNVFIDRVSRDTRRINILMEGDSWFDYPRKYFIGPKPRNIADWMKLHLSHHQGIANLLSIAHSGDTTFGMSTTPGSFSARRILKQVGAKLDFLLVSAGGNDIAGPQMLRMTRKPQPGGKVADCITADFYSTLDGIEQRYTEVLAMLQRKHFKVQVIAHSYCYIEPQKKGFEFLFWRIGDGWIARYLEANQIPGELHPEIVKIMLDAFHKRLVRLSEQFPQFHVVDFRDGLLNPGSEADWADEMHATSEGFKKLTRRFVEKIHQLDSRFPLL